MEIYPNIANVRFQALGTDIEVQLVIEDDKQREAAAEAFADVRGLYAACAEIFSRFDKGSELNGFNDRLGEFRDASLMMKEIAAAVLCYHSETGGMFDPRILASLEDIGYRHDFKQGNFIKNDRTDVASDLHRELAEDLKLENNRLCFGVRMDFSGIAKGYITDQAAKLLRKGGWRNFLIDSGGDMRVEGGSNASENGWPIAIEGVPEEKVAFKLSGVGVATSGISRRKWELGGERFHHLINPRNPYRFDFELKSVTVIAESTERVDVLAKTLFLFGKQEGSRWAEKKGLAAIFLDSRGNSLMTRKAKELLVGQDI